MNSNKLKIFCLLLGAGFCFLFVFCKFALATVPAKSPESSKKKITSGRWKYIVIHHSATPQGNALHFDKYHRRRGMRNGLAYHFVINNGTSSRQDGELEIGSRWKKQLDGGHCKQSWINHRGIGICLVGNFNKQKVTKRQYQTLFKLCKLLMDRYNIPVSNILGHGQVKGEHSLCPGKFFPIREFKRILTRYQESRRTFVP